MWLCDKVDVLNEKTWLKPQALHKKLITMMKWNENEKDEQELQGLKNGV